jgi:hypothetical protein
MLRFDDWLKANIETLPDMSYRWGDLHTSVAERYAAAVVLSELQDVRSKVEAQATERIHALLKGRHLEPSNPTELVNKANEEWIKKHTPQDNLSDLRESERRQD